MKIKYHQIGNATAIISVGNMKICVDPALDPAGTVYEKQRKRVRGPVYDQNTFNDIDLWLISHPHSDHIDNTGVKVINSKVICSKSSLKFLQKNGVNDTTVITHGQSTFFEKQDVTLEVLAVNALHGHNKLIRLALLGINGYLLKFTYKNETKSIYITSDTIYHQQVIDSLQDNNVDFLVGTLGDVVSPYPLTKKPITMSISELQLFEKALTPKHTLATHINDYSHFETNMKETKKLFNVIENGEKIELEL